VAGVAFGHVDIALAWQAWHLRHTAGSGGAPGPPWSPLTRRSFKYFELRGRRGTYGTELALVVLGISNTLLMLCSELALGISNRSCKVVSRT